MSLINEALKKAQRSRHEDQADASAPEAAGGIRIPKRSKAQNANTVVLLGAGALVLVVLSVVATVILVNRPSPHAAAAQNSGSGKTSAAPVDVASSSASAPTPVAATAETATAPLTLHTGSVVATPASAVSTSAPAISIPAPAASAPMAAVDPSPTIAPAAAAATAATAPAAPPPPTGPDERIAAFVEAIRVTGIRSSGNESRVLMNERVFRVNEVVERTLNLRLIKVTGDTLTFSDANGVTYEKHF